MQGMKGQEAAILVTTTYCRLLHKAEMTSSLWPPPHSPRPSFQQDKKHPPQGSHSGPRPSNPSTQKPGSLNGWTGQGLLSRLGSPRTLQGPAATLPTPTPHTSPHPTAALLPLQAHPR